MAILQKYLPAKACLEVKRTPREHLRLQSGSKSNNISITCQIEELFKVKKFF
jgi:hypothetical protein